MRELYLAEEHLLRLSGQKNKIILLKKLFKGIHLFGDLHHGIPTLSVAELTKELQEMERDGLIQIVGQGQDIAHARFYLTPRGISLKHLLDIRRAEAHQETLLPHHPEHTP
jgi:DNA-binding HxlR family transcriptional regulator